MTDFYYYLGPSTRSERGGLGGGACWLMPAGSLGSVRLQEEGDAAIPGSSAGMRFLCSESPLSEEFTLLGRGDCREIASTALMRSAWESATGVAVEGDTLADLLGWAMTDGADPDGLDTTPPLTPDAAGDLIVHLAGHSPIWRRRFVWATDPHRAKFEAMLKRDLREIRKRSKNGEYKPAHGIAGDTTYHQQYAQGLMDRAARWGLTDFEAIRPSDWPKDEKPKPHGSVIGDTFVDTSQTLLTNHTATGPNGGFSWASSSAGFKIDSANKVYSAGGLMYARAESDLAGGEHYAQTVPVSTTGAVHPQVRMDSGDYNGYMMYWAWYYGTPAWVIFKQTADTELAHANASDPGSGLCYLEADGSTLTAKFNGSQVVQVTDTTYGATRVRCGMCGYEDTGDDFEAGDLAAAPVTLVVQDSACLVESGNVALTQHQVLVVANSECIVASESPALIQHQVLTVADSECVVTSDNVTLTQHNVLVVQDSACIVESEQPSLTQHHVLAVADSECIVESEQIVLVQHFAGLTVQDSECVVESDNVVLVQHQVLTVADSECVVTSDNVTLAVSAGSAVLYQQQLLLSN